MLAQQKLLIVQDFFPTIHPLIKNLFLKIEIFNVPPAGRLNFFYKELEKVTTDPNLSYVERCKVPLVEMPS